MGIRINAEDTELSDAVGVIPSFPPRASDANGRPIPLSPEEREARRDAALRVLNAFKDLPNDGPPDLFEDGMRAIDANRAPGFKLFEGMY